jgi:threonine-phosphate decarboxylase
MYPNNPTGKVFDKAELTALISKHSDICFVIDQSYEDFTLKPLLSASEAAEFPNVILLHSLTKRFSIPGLRLGYLTASSALLDEFA